MLKENEKTSSFKVSKVSKELSQKEKVYNF